MHACFSYLISIAIGLEIVPVGVGAEVVLAICVACPHRRALAKAAAVNKLPFVGGLTEHVHAQPDITWRHCHDNVIFRLGVNRDNVAADALVVTCSGNSPGHRVIGPARDKLVHAFLSLFKYARVIANQHLCLATAICVHEFVLSCPERYGTGGSRRRHARIPIVCRVRQRHAL